MSDVSTLEHAVKRTLLKNKRSFPSTLKISIQSSRVQRAEKAKRAVHTHQQLVEFKDHQLDHQYNRCNCFLISRHITMCTNNCEEEANKPWFSL